MKVWLLSSKPPVSPDTAYLVGRVLSHASSIEVTQVAECDGFAIDPPAGVDVILNRSFVTNRGFLAGLDGLSRSRRIPVVNPGAATYAACDKRTYPWDYPGRIPPTRTAGSRTELAAAVRELGGAVVVKDPFGKRGEKVERLLGPADFPLAERLLTASSCGELIVQRYCPGFEKGDKRVLLQSTGEGGYEITGYYARIPAPGGWKSNVCAGGRVVATGLDEDERRFSLETAALSNLDYVGLDIARQEGKPLLIETNSYTGGQIDFDMLSNGDSAEKLAQLLERLAGEKSLYRWLQRPA